MADELSLTALKDQYIPSAEFYSQLVNSLSDYSIFTVDQSLKINSWSTGASSIFGYETDEVIGKGFDLIFSEEDKRNGVPLKKTREALEFGRATDNRWHVCKDGSEFYAFGLIFPLAGLKGEPLGFVTILRDLTKRRLSDNAIRKQMIELEALNAHKENILATLSHDLRTPLSGIIGAADYLAKNFGKMKEAEVKEMLEAVYKAASDELVMLDYLVEWGRIKYASEVFSPEQISLREPIEKVFEILSEVAISRGIVLKDQVRNDAWVFADRKMLLSILQNIISNALKYTLTGGVIEVFAEKKPDHMVVSVRDNGMGMNEETRSKLFTAQIGKLSVIREENKGAGIGLLLVKSFVEKNGGEIWAESTEGLGSVFHFTLPLSEPVGFKEVITAGKSATVTP